MGSSNTGNANNSSTDQNINNANTNNNNANTSINNNENNSSAGKEPDTQFDALRFVESYDSSDDEDSNYLGPNMPGLTPELR
jgi:hypothetical protein